MNNGGERNPSDGLNGGSMLEASIAKSNSENPNGNIDNNSSNRNQISIKNLMIDSLNSAGSDVEDSVTGDSTSDFHTERYFCYFHAAGMFVFFQKNCCFMETASVFFIYCICIYCRSYAVDLSQSCLAYLSQLD